MALAKVACNVKACIHASPLRHHVYGNVMWRDAAIRANRENIDISYGVTSKELSPLFNSLLDRKVSTLPILVDANPASAPKSALKHIGIFGNQNSRKGDFMIPDLVQSLLKLGYKVTVQDSKGRITADQVQNLIILDYVEDLSKEIYKCDLVLLPYNPSAYKGQSSGIAWEAMACGVPVIAPAETIPGDFVKNHEAGVTFAEFTVDGIVDSVLLAKSDFKTIALGAFNASNNWAANHGTIKFVEAMLS